MIYKRVELKDGELVHFVGTYVSAWDYERWGQPQAGFVESVGLLEVCKEALIIAEDALTWCSERDKHFLYARKIEAIRKVIAKYGG